MAGIEDSDAVSSTSDEVVNCISTPIQDGFDDQVTMDIALCNLEPTEESNTVPVSSNPAQEDAPNDSIFVTGINGHQVSLITPEQKHFSSRDKDLSESSECGDERDDAYSMSSVMEENKTLKKKNRALEEQVEKLMKENEAQKQQLEKVSAGHGFVQSKEEQFNSAACVQQLWRGVRQEEMDNSMDQSSFQECKEDARGDLDSTGDDYVVPQEASCDCKHYFNQQLADFSNQVQMQNKHQMLVKSIPGTGVTCTCIVPYCKVKSDLNGDGVLIAILGPPCKTDGVPEKSIILKHTVPKYVQDGACESVLLEMAYPRAPGAKYCILQTTSDNYSMCVNPGVTAEALSFLIEKWPQWKKYHSLHTLIVIIPYGGKYKVDEEKAVNEANAYGIIIVAAGGWGRMGIAFPAKLGAVISVAAMTGCSTLVPFFPVSRELDCVGLGFMKIGNDFMIGAGISTIMVATDLALLFQHFSCTNSALIRNTCIDTYVLRALFELIAGDIMVSGDDVMAIIDLPNLQVSRFIKHILWCRDRRTISSDPMQEDAQSNTKHWSSENVNKQYRKECKDFLHLTGVNITIAIIDKVEEAFLLHLKDHGVKVHTATEGVKYFRFCGTMLFKDCCIKHIKVAGGHGLQCAAIVANTAPNCTILMVIHSDLDRSEKVALSIVMKQKADILMLSSVTTDTVDSDYLYNISAHLSCRIVLCAAGNEGKRDRTSTICYPSHAGDAIVIGACDRHGERCPYSSCGKQVDFLCPGQFSIADSSGKGGTCYSTSAAAAFIALLLEYIDKKLSTATPIEVWVSMEEETKLQTLPNLARNTHLMRVLLSSKKLSLCQRTEHSSTEGYGALLIDNLNMLTPDGISQLVSDFHLERNV